MSRVLNRLDSRLGLKLPGGERVNHLAFANDMALLSAMPVAMNKLLTYCF